MSYSYKLLDNEIANKIETPFPKMISVTKINNPDCNTGLELPNSPCVLPKTYITWSEKIKNFHVRKTDVWLVTYPKCGTTWAAEMIWLICNNFNVDAAKTQMQSERFPIFEEPVVRNTTFDMIAHMDQLESPRFFKTHLPVSFLPNQLWTVHPKIIYVYRNPKDVAVSWYHHHIFMRGYTGPLEYFIDAFVNGYLVYGDYADHVRDFMKTEKLSNVCFIRYENMKTNLKHELQIAINFLEVLCTENDIKLLIKHISFESMKENPACNNQDIIKAALKAMGRGDEKPKKFMRKGKIGSYKDDLTPELENKLDIWLQQKFSTNELKEIFDIVY